MGVLLYTCWEVGLASCVTWLVMALLFRYSSLSALAALILAPVYAYFFATPEFVYFYSFLAVLAVIRHHENIRRLLRGEESKIKLKKKAA